MKKIIFLSFAYIFAGVAHGQSRSDVIAATLILEAGGEGYIGMVAVANVIDNRAKAKGKSHYSVITAPRQFSALNGKSKARVVALARRHPRWDMAKKIVRQLQKGGLADITYGALFYDNKKNRPSWSYNMVVTCTIKNHVFYRG